MIPFDFEYYKPDTLKEATKLFAALKAQGKEPLYYGGGTEFISMARVQNIYAGAVIDIKGIPECNVYEYQKDELIIGSAVTLTQIAKKNLFPLLSQTVKRIADHTIQGKITLGGNLAGTIIYKESALPLMVSNSEVIIMENGEQKRMLIADLYNKGKKLSRDSVILQVIVNKSYTDCPYFHIKRTQNEKIDYPLVTVAALKDNKSVNIAFSGLYQHPFRSVKVENAINENTSSKNNKITKAVQGMPDEMLDDIRGSSEYRKFVLHTALTEALDRLEVAN